MSVPVDFSFNINGAPKINWCTMSSIKETEIENLEVHQNVKCNTASTGTLDLIFTSNKIHVTDFHTLGSNDKYGK